LKERVARRHGLLWMRLIVDTNVLFAFFGNKRIVEIFEKLRSKGRFITSYE
jgi:hypothetical protein